MELKLESYQICKVKLVCLNRTFYGIETRFLRMLKDYEFSLNRTFYGIETKIIATTDNFTVSLNRTFYGIETLI